MTFLRYPHVERLGAPDVEGIDVGECLVFPKLDGTNASAWYTSHEVLHLTVRGGSRNRELSIDVDNHGFAQWLSDQGPGSPLAGFFSRRGSRYRLYGEWLVPHTFKAYRDEAWRRFWIFDVYDDAERRFVPFDEYQPWLNNAGLDYVPPIATVTNPTEEQLRRIAEGNTFLVKDGAGPGEGIVVKRYDFVNRYGRVTWAKVVRGEFKDANAREFGPANKGEVFQVEIAIAGIAVTPELVAKERRKIEGDLLCDEITAELRNPSYPSDWERLRAARLNELRGSLIPRLLETVYHCVCTEELWSMLRKFKDPTVDFKKLRRHVIARTKIYASDLF